MIFEIGKRYMTANGSIVEAMYIGSDPITFKVVEVTFKVVEGGHRYSKLSYFAGYDNTYSRSHYITYQDGSYILCGDDEEIKGKQIRDRMKIVSAYEDSANQPPIRILNPEFKNPRKPSILELYKI